MHAAYAVQKDKVLNCIIQCNWAIYSTLKFVSRKEAQVRSKASATRVIDLKLIQAVISIIASVINPFDRSANYSGREDTVTYYFKLAAPHTPSPLPPIYFYFGYESSTQKLHACPFNNYYMNYSGIYTDLNFES